MSRVLPIDIPEQGQLVEIRQQRYVVVTVEPGTVPHSVYPNGIERTQHLLALSCIEDDALGEELEVIWELEVGARMIDDANLPAITGFDAPQRLDTFLDAVRWGAASSADIRALQAPFRSGIYIEDYQNLTEHALSLNMELGILIQGGPLPAAVAAHFQRLIENQILVKLE